MRILHLSDAHGEIGVVEKIVEVEDYDLVVATGDFEDLNIVRELARLDKPALAVTGNIDTRIIESELTTLQLSIEGIVKKVGDYFFAGISGRHVYSSAAQVISSLLSTRNSAPLIVVSHYPPSGVKVDLAYSGIHIGKGILREFIEEFEPVLFLCGHVHEARGYDILGGTVIVNPGPLYMGYYAVIEADSLKVELKKI